VTITPEDLIQIADDIFTSVLAGADSGQLDDAPSAEPAPGPPRTLTAVVDISGDWNGCVSVSCGRETAVGIASAMFDSPAPELSSEDVVDALGELANMAGGAVKGMIEGDKALGLPTVAEGVDMVLAVPRTTEIAGVDHDVATGGRLRFAVHQVR
jgi:chemotaxis protein CheX